MQVYYVETVLPEFLQTDLVEVKVPNMKGKLQLLPKDADHYFQRPHFALCVNGKPVSSGYRYENMEHFLKSFKSKKQDDVRLGRNDYAVHLNGVLVNFFEQLVTF